MLVFFREGIFSSEVNLGQNIREWTKEDSLSRPCPFKFFKGCLPQILLGPFLNTLSHLLVFLLRNSHWRCSVRKGVLRKFAKFTGKQARNFIKKQTLVQAFSCEFCEISKNAFFIEHVRATVSLIVGFNTATLLIINSLLNFCERSFRFSQQLFLRTQVKESFK